MTGAVRLVYCPFGSEEEAMRVAAATVEQRLAACANVMAPIRSVFRWEGDIASEAEVPVLFKTDVAHVEALIERIAALHSYDVPAVIALPEADCPPAFAAWLAGELGGGSAP